MRIPFDGHGGLPPSIHWVSWQDMVSNFGFTKRRVELLAGLKEALDLLRRAGCQAVYIDGSFVTSKSVPGDSMPAGA